MNYPKISVCIPAYNRAALLPALLDSVFEQDFESYDVVIAEDGSPEREEIKKVTSEYSDRYPGRLTYIENSTNLGYDGNLRNMFSLATGDYIFFLGNDDLMCAGALAKVADAVTRYPDVGVVLRTYAAFEGVPENVVETFRYFDNELFFPAGAETVGALYRRSVVIPGMVFHRESALALSTDRFDGTLLYQLYLVAEILVDKNAVYLPEVTVLYRNGGVPDFGSSAVEQGKFKPKEQTPESSLHFIEGMLDIARYVEEHRSVKIYNTIFRDMANYSYPLLSIQSNKAFPVFIKYGRGLAKLGFWKYPMFWVYFLALLLFGDKFLSRIIVWLKRKLGVTPSIGSLYRGRSS